MQGRVTVLMHGTLLMIYIYLQNFLFMPLAQFMDLPVLQLRSGLPWAQPERNSILNYFYYPPPNKMGRHNYNFCSVVWPAVCLSVRPSVLPFVCPSRFRVSDVRWRLGFSVRTFVILILPLPLVRFEELSWPDGWMPCPRFPPSWRSPSSNPDRSCLSPK